jgi:hypothetical protein
MEERESVLSERVKERINYISAGLAGLTIGAVAEGFFSPGNNLDNFFEALVVAGGGTVLGRTIWKGDKVSYGE